MTEFYYRKSQLSRADLLEILATGDKSATAFLAKQLALQQEYSESLPTDEKEKLEDNKEPTLETDVNRYLKKTPLPVKHSTYWWRLDKIETTQQQAISQQQAEAMAPVSWSTRPTHYPAFHPLVSPRSLLPRLLHHLKSHQQAHAVDVNRVVKTISKGKWLRYLPRMNRRSLGRHLHIIQDRYVHLTPYWLDQRLFSQLLASYLPEYAVSHALLHETNDIPYTESSNGFLVGCLPPDNSVVLVFSDLGALSDNPQSQISAWLDWGTTLQRKGCQLIAVIPCHPDECDPRLKNLFTLEPWLPVRQLHKCEVVERKALANQLLGFLAPVIRLEPGLLRGMRVALIKQGFYFPISVEAAVWQHPDLLEPSSVAATLNSEARVQWLQKFKDLPGEQQQTVLQIIRSWRGQLSEQVWFEEIISLNEATQTLLSKADQRDAENYFKHLSQRYLYSSSEALADPDTLAWFKRLEKRVPEDTWATTLIGASLQQIAAVAHQQDKHYRSDYPIDPGNLLPLPESLTQTAVLYQVGKYLEFKQAGLDLAAGSPLTPIRFRRELLYFEYLDDPGKPQKSSGRSIKFQLRPEAEIDLCLLPNTNGLLVRSDIETLYFNQIQKPLWALTIGNDRQGLFVKTQSATGEHYRYDWHPPIAEAQNTACPGFWYPGKNIALPWHIEQLGRDAFGLFADLTFRGITQRFRWIQPGAFLMGSPEDEPERYDNETQHQVILSQGYWLADTACTQAVWQAVMGSNPSEFKNNLENPVEQVSWSDVQEFISKLNAGRPELNAGLPTEAQWEYACRAGTATRYSFGDEISAEQVNYAGNQGKTLPVKSLPANAWGLYEMHGNVWEWCQDWHGEYPTRTDTDPIGASKSARRVLRGGAWRSGARRARSAYRSWNDPGSRNRGIGFRLALGQTDRPEGRRAVAGRTAAAERGGQASHRTPEEDDIFSRLMKPIKPK